MRLAPLSFNALSDLFRVAVTANSLNEFEQTLTQILSQQPLETQPLRQTDFAAESK